MKPWMKFLMWFGLGGFVGFFAGQQVGYNKAKKEDEFVINDAYNRGREDAFKVEPATIYKVEEIGPNDAVDIQSVEEYQKSMREKYGWPDPEWQVVDQPGTDEDAEMPMDEPVVPEPENEGVHVESHEEVYPDGTSIRYGSIEGPDTTGVKPVVIAHDGVLHQYDTIEEGAAAAGDIISHILVGRRADGNPVDEYAGQEIHAGDIPQFHPTFLDIRVVDKSEYDNRGDLDEENLIFYEGDEVLYNCRTQQIIPDDEYNATIGVGTLEAFRVGPGPAKDEIYVINENNCRYTIQRMDDAFTDAVDGNCAPTDDDNDEADEEDDFWNDGDG